MDGETWVWDRYWQYDRIASCMDPGRQNYDDRVAAGWRDFFASLARHSRILDLCTGNGAIALLAAEASARADKAFEIIGVDRADIDPHRYVKRFAKALERVKFSGRVDAERLPFPDGSFASVVSQYGLEYTDLARSVAEAMRVLGSGGAFRFVVHAAEGKVAAGAKRVVADADFLLEQVDIVGEAARCIAAVTAVERSAAPGAEEVQHAQALTASFQRALNRSAEYMKTAANKGMIHNAASVLIDAFEKRAHFEPAVLAAKAEEVRTEIAAHRGRSLALVGSALTHAEARNLGQRLASLGGRDATCSALAPSGELVGYVIQGRRD